MSGGVGGLMAKREGGGRGEGVITTEPFILALVSLSSFCLVFCSFVFCCYFSVFFSFFCVCMCVCVCGGGGGVVFE